MSLVHITAKHPKTLTSVDLYFKNISEAKKFNPTLYDFRYVDSMQMVLVKKCPSKE